MYVLLLCDVRYVTTDEFSCEPLIYCYVIDVTDIPLCQPEQWCRRRGCRGCKLTPNNFVLSKIRGKFLKNLGKIPENPGKMAPNVVWLQKMAPKVCKKSHEDFFGVTSQLFLRGHTKIRPSWPLWENFIGKSCTNTFQASLGKYGQKSFAPPKIRRLLRLWNRMRVNGNFSDASLERLLSVGIG